MNRSNAEWVGRHRDAYHPPYRRWEHRNTNNSLWFLDRESDKRRQPFIQNRFSRARALVQGLIQVLHLTLEKDRTTRERPSKSLMVLVHKLEIDKNHIQVFKKIRDRRTNERCAEQTHPSYLLRECKIEQNNPLSHIETFRHHCLSLQQTCLSTPYALSSIMEGVHYGGIPCLKEVKEYCF